MISSQSKELVPVHHRCKMVIIYLVLLMIRSAQLNPLMAKGI